MNCKFQKVEDKLVCTVCGYSIKKDIDPNLLYKTCRPNKTKEEVAETVSKYPSMFQMAKNAVTAAVAFVGDGFKTADAVEQTRRLDICKGCDQYDKEQNRCYQCGCYLTFKTKIEGGGCPLNKW